LVRLAADRVGLTSALSTAPARPGLWPVHDRGRVLVDLAVALADGATTIGAIDTLRHQGELFASVASDTTVWRALEEATTTSRAPDSQEPGHGPVLSRLLGPEKTGGCCVVRSRGEIVDSGWSDRQGQLVDGRRHPQRRGFLGPEFVVSAAEVPHEGVASADHPCTAELFQAAHRPQPGLQPAMIEFDPVVSVRARCGARRLQRSHRGRAGRPPPCRCHSHQPTRQRERAMTIPLRWWCPTVLVRVQRDITPLLAPPPPTHRSPVPTRDEHPIHHLEPGHRTDPSSRLTTASQPPILTQGCQKAPYPPPS